MAKKTACQAHSREALSVGVLPAEGVGKCKMTGTSFVVAAVLALGAFERRSQRAVEAGREDCDAVLAPMSFGCRLP